MKNILFISALFLLASCGNKKEETKSAGSELPANLLTLSESQLASAQIATGKMEIRTLSSQIKVTGKIDVPPQNMISVSVPLGGYLQSSHLLPGMQVKKGEVIAVLEDQQYIQLQQDYLTCQSKINYLASEYARQKTLNESKTTSDKIFQQTQMEYNNQKINLAALGEKLKLININPKNISEQTLSKSIQLYSPINGFVSKVNVNPGKYLTSSDVLFELINPYDIHLNLKIFEKDLDKLFIGQKLVAYTNNQPDKKYDCEILLISKDISPDRTADVHCHFEKYDKSLLPGTYMNAVIEVNNLQSASLPEEAVVNFEGQQYIFTVESKNRFLMTAVETGIEEKGFIKIKNAAALTNKPIVIKNAYTLLMALKNKAE